MYAFYIINDNRFHATPFFKQQHFTVKYFHYLIS